MSTIAEVFNGAVAISTGKGGKAARVVKLKIPCDAKNTAHYGVPLALFNNRAEGLSATFPSAVRLEVQFDFKFDDTSLSKVEEFGDWIGGMAKKIRGLVFPFPCEIFIAVTDNAHLYQDSEDYLVALDDVADHSNDAAVVIMGNRGKLVQVGVTGY